MTSVRSCVSLILLSVALAWLVVSCATNGSASREDVSHLVYSAKRMPDSLLWTSANLNVQSRSSYCYENSDVNCLNYGRLYTWEAAQQGCRLLGAGWRLPTEDEWRQMARHYGGVRDDSSDTGQAAYNELLIGGSSGFNALLAGNRAEDGQYARLQAHGFYWTATETGPATAWFYNFGEGGRSLNRHRDGDKGMAVSVRCVRE
jgi:uncharacterized protein (TIGR02145 family)